MEVIANLAGDRCSVARESGERQILDSVVVAGPYTRPLVLGTAQQQHSLGVIFRTGAASALLGLPLDELRDRHLSLTELWGPGAAELHERAAAASTPRATLAAVEELLEARLRRLAKHPSRLASAAAARVAMAPHLVHVSGLSEELGISARRLEQVFCSEIGLAPKTYQRLQRFQRALRRLDRAANDGWAQFACDHGYYDQSHLIREFRAHAGMTPVEYMAARGPFQNHVALAN